MVIDLTEVRDEMKRRLADANSGIQSAEKTYGEDDLRDPDSLVGLARAEGIDLARYEIGTNTPPDHETFELDLDATADLGDLNDDVDDLDGDYY